MVFWELSVHRRSRIVGERGRDAWWGRTCLRCDTGTHVSLSSVICAILALTYFQNVGLKIMLKAETVYC